MSREVARRDIATSPLDEAGRSCAATTDGSLRCLCEQPELTHRTKPDSGASPPSDNRSMRIGILGFGGTVVGACLGLGFVTFASLQYDFAAHPALHVAEAGIFMFMLVATVFLALRARWVAFTAGRPQLQDRAPAELVVPLFALPVSTALTGTAIALPSLVVAQVERWNPGIAESAGLMSLEIAIGGAFIAFAIPFVALANVIEEREGRRGALFDPATTKEQFELTLADRWESLAETRRWWLPATRRASLGTPESPPAFAWPRHTEPHRCKFLDRVPHITIGAGVAATAIVLWGAIASQFDGSWAPAQVVVAAAIGAIQAALALLVAWLWIHSESNSEQGKADLLRLARAERTEPALVVEAPHLAMRERLQLIRRALSRTSRDAPTPL